MTAAPPPPNSQRRIDVRELTVVQLHHLASRGSRRARAELDRRMGALTDEPEAPQPPTLTQVIAPAGVAWTRPSPQRPPSPRVAPSQPPPASPSAGDPDLLIRQLQLIERQQLEHARTSGTPRLIGLMLLLWAALLALGGLALLFSGGGPYYLFCGLACGGVGALLMRSSHWAMHVHGAALLLALAWAWSETGTLPATLVQAAPVLVAALWMVLSAARDPLE